MKQNFKEGDEVFVVTHTYDGNPLRTASLSKVSNVHKGNGNAIVGRRQFTQTGSCAGQRMTGPHIIIASDENKALVANAKALEIAVSRARGATRHHDMRGCKTPDDVRQSLLDIVKTYDELMEKEQ